MASIFDTVAVNKIRKSLFNLSHMRKFSASMGYLVPIQVTECLPNEDYHIHHEALVKFSPLLAPMMQECDMYIEDFFVPNRLVWDNWNDFITPSDDGTFPAMPYTTFESSNYNTGFGVGTLADYLGLPSGTLPASSLNICTLPFRAYQLIWNEYYRDQNLQAEINIKKNVDGVEQNGFSRGLYTLRKRCWPKDYFTSALPTTQRGGDVTLPIQGTAVVKVSDSASATNLSALKATATSGSTSVSLSTTTSTSGIANGRLFADLSNGSYSAPTINELRRATALQEYLELNMRVGGRINEYIYGNFGRRVPDYRIDRPQFIGGYRAPIVVSQVNQTSSTDSTSPIATMAGQAIGTGNTRTVKYNTYEHGYIISLMSVLPKASYQQGLPRKFTRFDPLDFANPKFGNLGEQAILNKEVYAAATSPDGTFGYTPRYSEYKYEPSTVHGEFKTTLNYWHMGRIFASEPALNGSFVESDPATRPFAVESSNDKIRVEVYNKVKALRPLPYYGTPKLI